MTLSTVRWVDGPQRLNLSSWQPFEVHRDTAETRLLTLQFGPALQESESFTFAVSPEGIYERKRRGVRKRREVGPNRKDLLVTPQFGKFSWSFKQSHPALGWWSLESKAIKRSSRSAVIRHSGAMMYTTELVHSPFAGFLKWRVPKSPVVKLSEVMVVTWIGGTTHFLRDTPLYI